MEASAGRKYFSSELLLNGWSAEFRHCHDGSVKAVKIDALKDLKDIAGICKFRRDGYLP